MRIRLLVTAFTAVLFVAYAALASAPHSIPAASGGSSPTAAEEPSATEVKIDNFTFAPHEIKVRAGTQVTWVNRDDIPHNVIAEDKSFRSKAIDTDEKFTFTPAKPGTYAYFCGIHPKMKGTLVVE